MNRAITGAWGAHRNKISLNSPLATPPPPGSAAAAALAAKAENDTANDAGAGVGAGAGAGAEPAGQGEGNLESRARLTSPRPEQPLGAVASSSDSRPGQASSSPATAGVPVGVASTNAGPSTSTSTSTKRKLRPSRDGGTSSVGKRAKASSASSIAEKYTPPTTRLADLGGVAGAIEKVLELIAMPLCHPEIYAHTGVKPPRGVLLHGPPGCGKTMLAGAIAGVSSGLVFARRLVAALCYCSIMLIMILSAWCDAGALGPLPIRLCTINSLGHLRRERKDVTRHFRRGCTDRACDSFHRRD